EAADDCGPQGSLHRPLRFRPGSNGESQRGAVTEDALDSPDLGLARDLPRGLWGFDDILRSLEGDAFDQVDVVFRFDGDVDESAPQALRRVAETKHLSVADEPERAVDSSEAGHAYTDLLDRSADLANRHPVSNAELILKHHEDAVQHIFYEVLR